MMTSAATSHHERRPLKATPLGPSSRSACRLAWRGVYVSLQLAHGRMRQSCAEPQRPALPAWCTVNTRAVIEVSNVVKRYGAITVLNGATFSIAEGQLTTILGPSGCGT